MTSNDSYLKLARSFAPNGKGPFGSRSSRWNGPRAATLGTISVVANLQEALVYIVCNPQRQERRLGPTAALDGDGPIGVAYGIGGLPAFFVEQVFLVDPKGLIDGRAGIRTGLNQPDCDTGGVLGKNLHR